MKKYVMNIQKMTMTVLCIYFSASEQKKVCLEQKGVVEQLENDDFLNASEEEIDQNMKGQELFMDIGEIITWVIYLGRTAILSITGFILYAFVFLPVLCVIVKLIKIFWKHREKD